MEKGREAEPLLPSPGRHPLGVASRGTHGCTTLDGGLPTLVPPFQRNKANNQKSTTSNDQNQFATTRINSRPKNQFEPQEPACASKNQFASPRISNHQNPESGPHRIILRHRHTGRRGMSLYRQENPRRTAQKNWGRPEQQKNSRYRRARQRPHPQAQTH